MAGLRYSTKYSSAADRYRGYQLGQAVGRRPAFDAGGELRGLRSASGAPVSPRDMLYGRDPTTGFTPKDVWQRQFGQRGIQPPTATAPASPGSLTTDTTQMPPPGAFASPIKLGLAPDLAGITPNATDAASVTARPYTPPVFDAAAVHQDAIVKNAAAVDALDPNFKIVASPFSDSPAGRGVSGRYGRGYTRTAAEVADEQKRRADEYKNSVDVQLGGYYA